MVKFVVNFAVKYNEK